MASPQAIKDGFVTVTEGASPGQMLPRHQLPREGGVRKPVAEFIRETHESLPVSPERIGVANGPSAFSGVAGALPVASTHSCQEFGRECVSEVYKVTHSQHNNTLTFPKN